MDYIDRRKISIKVWAEEDRPREKLLNLGRRALTDAELIPVLIGTGNIEESAVSLSQRILYCFGNDLSVLGKLSVSDLSKFKGIGEAKAVSIIAALELGRRRKERDSSNLLQITCSKNIFDLLRPYYDDLLQEEFWILVLNRSNRVTNKVLISKGGQSSTVVDPKIIFKAALENNAASIVLSHNHPSGNFQPSQPDIHLTDKIVSGARLLDIQVYDHLIFGDGAYYSLADEGLM